MKPGDRELLFWLAVIIVVLVAALLFLRRAGGAVGNLAGGGLDLGLPSSVALEPWGSTVPGFPDISIGGAAITVNAQSPSFSWLSPYFPLFGFVGVDATQIYQ